MFHTGKLTEILQLPVDREEWVLWATVNETFTYINTMMRFGNDTEEYVKHTIHLLEPLVDRYYSDGIKSHDENLMGKVISDMACPLGSKSYSGLKIRV